MKSYQLQELVEISGGGTPNRKVPEYWNGNIPWVTVKDFKGAWLVSSMDSITDAGLANSASKLIPSGTVIVPTRMALGKAAINTVDVAINQDLKALKVKDPAKLNRDYLFRFVMNKAEYFESKGKGATVKGITLDVLKELPVTLPPLEEQKRIAAILDKADEIRRKRQQAIELADQFLKSVFLDMFGDPATNPLGWPLKELQELAIDKDGIKCGPFGTQLNKAEFTTFGVPLWGIKHVNRHFGFETNEFISHEKAVQLSGYSLIPDDIVMTRKGTVGNASVYPAAFPLGMMHSDLLRVRLNQGVCKPAFLSYQLRISRDIGRQIQMVSSGAIMAGINVSKLKSIQVLVPPLALQAKFVALSDAVFSHTLRYRDHSSGIDSLLGSLAQRAFKGELTSAVPA